MTIRPRRRTLLQLKFEHTFYFVLLLQCGQWKLLDSSNKTQKLPQHATGQTSPKRRSCTVSTFHAFVQTHCQHHHRDNQCHGRPCKGTDRAANELLASARRGGFEGEKPRPGLFAPRPKSMSPFGNPVHSQFPRIVDRQPNAGFRHSLHVRQCVRRGIATQSGEARSNTIRSGCRSFRHGFQYPGYNGKGEEESRSRLWLYRATYRPPRPLISPLVRAVSTLAAGGWMAVR